MRRSRATQTETVSWSASFACGLLAGACMAGGQVGVNALMEILADQPQSA